MELLIFIVAVVMAAFFFVVALTEPEAADSNGGQSSGWGDGFGSNPEEAPRRPLRTSSRPGRDGSRRPPANPRAGRRERVRSGRGPGVRLLGTCRRSRVTPQRVCEDPDGSSGCSHVLNLTRGNPVIDRATTHSDCFARLHDREGLAVHMLSQAFY